MSRKFSQDQLNKIMEQGLVRQCACPTLLTRLLSDTRYLHEYQKSCLEGSTTDERVHEEIARVTEIVSRILEDALINVLVLEEWEPDARGEYKMPENLVALQMNIISCGLERGAPR